MKKVIRLTESDLVRIVKRVINEQNIPEGYKDISQWFFTPEGVVYIPDGEYVVDGYGYQGTIKTKDGKDTGYIITLVGGIRGMLPKKLTISGNGGTLNYSQNVSKIYLNDSILNSSGIRKK